MLIQIRFNTDTLRSPERGLPEWRVLYDGQQFFASEIQLQVPSWSTKDEIEPGLWKWHITCQGQPEWPDESKTLRVLPLER